MIGRLIQTYRIDELLGEGGMGTVYRATDTMLERPVALKMLRPALLSQPQFLERFKSEAVTLAKLNHPNIATLYNFIREDNDYFMVLEYVEGQTLDQWLQAYGPLPYTLAVSVLMQALDGLQHAHKRSILHRDLKPANLMITPEGMVKIMDFGIARIMGSRRLTQVNRIIGTLEYMAPEQILGQEPTPQVDIYALGVVLYELLSGHVPLTGDSEYHTMERIMKETPAPLVSQIAEFPETLDQLLAKAMQKQPADRFDSARTYMQALSNLVPYAQLLDEDEIAIYQQPKQATLELLTNDPVNELTAIFDAPDTGPDTQQTQLFESPDVKATPVVISREPGKELAPISQTAKEVGKNPVKPKKQEGKTVKIPVQQAIYTPETAKAARKGLSTKRIIRLVVAFVAFVLVGLYWLGRNRPPELSAITTPSLPVLGTDSTLVANAQANNAQPSPTNAHPTQAGSANPPSAQQVQPTVSNQATGPDPGKPIRVEPRPNTATPTAANLSPDPLSSHQPASITTQPNTIQPTVSQAITNQNQPISSPPKPTDDDAGKSESSNRPNRAEETTADVATNRSAKSRSLRLPSGTEVVVELAEPLAAANATDGQHVTLRVTKSIIINGETVIERGASVDGAVTDVSTSGKKEMLEIKLETVRAITGKPLKLRSSTFKYVGERNQPLTFKPGQQFIVYTANALTL